MNDGAAPFPEDVLTAALHYADEHDWLVFPVPPGTKKSHTSAKGGNGRRWGASRDPMEIQYYFKKWPDDGVGLPTGEDNGFFVLEVDTFEAHGKDGLASLRALEAKHGRLPETLMAMSPTGSIHRYFAYPKTPGVDIRNSDSTLAPGVDIKANGGMVVAPPTRTEKGVYRWVNNLPIAEAPAWVITLALKGKRPQRDANTTRNAKHKPIDDDALRDVMQGVPNDLRTSWDDWNTVGMALYAGASGSSFAFELFDEWSKRREDKYDAEKTEAKWEAYRTSPPTTIGIRKLFYLANRAQFEAEVEAIADLEARCEWDRTPAEEAFDDITPEMLAEMAASSDPEWLTGLNTRYAFIHDRPDVVLDLRGSDRAIVRPLSIREFDNRHANKRASVGDKKLSISKLWFVHPRRCEYTTAGDYPIGKEPKGALNLWTGLPITPKPGQWSAIEEFLLAVICAGDVAHYDYLRDLLFWKVQNPTENPEVAIGLQSLQGYGKGTFGRFLERLFGTKRFQQFIRTDDATAKFNADVEGKMVLFYDEVFYGHDPRLRGRLKGEITERWLPIEPKGVNRYYVRNIALRVYVSNEIANIPIDLNDRRVLALAVSDIHAKDFAYFDRLVAAIEGDELAAFLHDALAADLSKFESARREPPKTKARARLAAATARPEEEYLAALLDRGQPLATFWAPRRYPRMAQEPEEPWRDGQITVERNTLFDDYREWMKRRQSRRSPVNNAEFHAIVQSILGSGLFCSKQVKLPKGGGKRDRLLAIGSLHDCRMAFDKHAGCASEWDDDDLPAGGDDVIDEGGLDGDQDPV